MIYYIYKNNTVYGSTENEELVDDIAVSMSIEDYEVGTTDFEDYSPNNNKYIIENGVIILNPNYEAEIEQAEKERIANIALTRADVFEALILARGLTKQMLRSFIEQDETLSEIERALYLNRFDDALEFYRKHPAIDFIATKLGISSDNMDKFFDTKDYTYLCVKTDEKVNTEEIVLPEEPTEQESPIVEDVTDVEDVNSLEE